MKKHELDTNETLDSRNKILDCKDKIKIKHDELLIFGINEDEYVIQIGVMCLTSTITSIPGFLFF